MTSPLSLTRGPRQPPGFVTSSLSLVRFGRYTGQAAVSATRAALLVLQLELGASPGSRHRFKSVSLLVRLRPVGKEVIGPGKKARGSAAKAAAAAAVPVSVLQYWPVRWEDQPTAVAVGGKVGVGGSVGLSGSPPLAGPSLWLDPSWERTRTYTRHARRNISGASVAAAAARSEVRWSLEENAAERDGVWEHFRVALVVRHTGSFAVEVGVRAKVGFTAHPRKLLWPLRGKFGARTVCDGVPIGAACEALDGDPVLNDIDIAQFTTFPRPPASI